MEKKPIVESLLKKYPIISGNITRNDARIILSHLKRVLDEEVEGEVVELGCNVGTTALFLRRMLDEFESKKEFHVYDSFEGLPEKRDKDKNAVERQYSKGDCRTSRRVLVKNFKRAKLKLPVIHAGWFSEIPAQEFPDKIAFAFFDGDFYSSIFDSFEKVYPLMTKNARLTIHDYQWDVLPGVERACLDFLKDKPEKGSLVNEDRIGIMVKK
jgi:O-methyltransferase